MFRGSDLQVLIPWNQRRKCEGETLKALSHQEPSACLMYAASL